MSKNKQRISDVILFLVLISLVWGIPPAAAADEDE